ncbi:tubulin-like doman-containing protein [Neobacillus drentensis]|uniref:tubulin-like doman-containing protein n=1 Tax=Neobacillus drentensis TaxID=220684 RepID=UPI001F445CAD|nr:tubulin-like doman-containing protein [Neobacillus drentensis]ULT56470.1 tubulin-like doman-containing protein [Neobacillus drentensis]
MRDLVQKYADSFSIKLEKISQSENVQRSVNYPIVFLFLGDLVKDALLTIKKMNKEKWHNSNGILYFHAYQSETILADNLFSLQLANTGYDRQSQRKELADTFNQDETMLIELNKTFRKLTTKLADYGRAFSSLQKVNLCVVTAIHDPANILIQEFTLLLKSILQESFRIVEVDLYGLLMEKQDGENFAFTTSLGISFLKELDEYQQNEYHFEKDLQLIEDHLRLPVCHPPSPLFDMVYLLSDKNENGLIEDEALQQNYELISHLNLLKNRKIWTEHYEKMNSYSHQSFKRAMKGNAGNPVYASAGFAKVTRPNKAIVLHVASQFYQGLLDTLKNQSKQPREKVLQLFDLSESSFQKYYEHFLPPADRLYDMHELMRVSNSYRAIRKLSLNETEEFLYEGGTETFFYQNFEEPVHEFLKVLDLREQIEWCFYENIINHEQYGIYCAYSWTADNVHAESNVMNAISHILEETKQEQLRLKEHLELTYQQIVDHCEFKKSLLPFSSKKNLSSFLEYFFEEIYGTKYELLRLKVKLEVLKQYRTVLKGLHRTLQPKISLMKKVDTFLKKTAADSLFDSDDDLDRNIAQYYSRVNELITAKLQEKRGPYFFLNERFFKNLYRYLEDDQPEILLERLLVVCDREVLTHEEFHRTFEDELLERANVLTDYENREILSKEELFQKLYLRLDESSSIHIEVFNYTQTNRYEEKYYFGDFNSQFMRFAMDKDPGMQWKVGCAHEKKSSGIEKLTLMGGFTLKDLIFYRNGEKYYKKYIENGYEFHTKAEASV